MAIGPSTGNPAPSRWGNERDSWGLVARLLHWTIALAILIEVPAGIVMSRTYMATDPVLAGWHYWTSNVHHTLGLTILVLAIGRGLWRLCGPVPEPAAPMPRRLRSLSRATHWLLYALLALIPLSGWAALSSLADSAQFGPTVLWLFGTNAFAGSFPRIVPAVAWDSDALLRYAVVAGAHRWLLYAGAAVLALHIAAALRHHFVLRDATLRRMWRGVAE